MAVTVCILGSTGSIGRQTLDVIRSHRDQYDVVSLSCNTNSDLLFDQCREFHPRYAVCTDEAAALRLRSRLKETGLSIEVLAGAKAQIDIANDSSSTLVVAAIVGASGLLPTFAAVEAGKKILLANKEALVLSGSLLMQKAQQTGATVLPVDSEHNALFQCMPPGYLPGHARPECVDGIVLTASGGPFLHRALNTFDDITPQQAVAHPNWSMGAKISVDSATMMNKGLEVMEAYWLFALPRSDIEVVIHPQSVIHSLLRYVDGSVLAECGVPDMRTPIAHCLGWPRRLTVDVKQLDLVEIGRFDFIAPDMQRFPCLKLAYDALDAGQAAMIVLNTANEIAVEAFLQGHIRYTQIPQLIEHYMSNYNFAAPKTIEDVVEMEREMRHAEHALSQI